MAWVQFLVREMRSHKLHGVAKKKKKKAEKADGRRGLRLLVLTRWSKRDQKGEIREET